MAINSAQVLRNLNTAHIYNLNTVSTESPAEITGKTMGMSMVVDNDPLAELMDSMEELSFMFEEKAAKKLSDRKMGEATRYHNRATLAIENWTQTFPDLPNQSVLTKFLQMLQTLQRNGQFPDTKGLLKLLQEHAKDPSHQFALLDIIEQGLTEGDSKTQATLQKTRSQLLDSHGDSIRAGINLAKEVNLRAKSPEEMQALRTLYRGEIFGFTTPQDCFRSILQTRGAAQLKAALEFLMAGCGVDLQSATPSQSPEKLRRIIVDLQCVEVLKTVFENLLGLITRMQIQFQETCLLNGEALTGRVLELTEHPFISAETIATLIAACGLQKWIARMDFCRELMRIFRLLSSRLFASENDRLQLQTAAQEELDEIISHEDEEQEKESRS